MHIKYKSDNIHLKNIKKIIVFCTITCLHTNHIVTFLLYAVFAAFGIKHRLLMTCFHANHHLPLNKKGKVNREGIEDAITVGMYSKQVPALDQEDVDWICMLINDLVSDYKRNPSEYRQS